MTIIRLLVLCIIIVSCSSKKDNSFSCFLQPSAALLELDSTLTSPMFDHGAWFGINLSENNLGLSQPLMLSDSNGYFFKEEILNVKYSENGKEAKNFINHFYPGSLLQEAGSENTQLTLKAVFLDDKTVLLAHEVRNLSSEPTTVNLEWTFPKPDHTQSNLVQYDLKNALLELEFSTDQNLGSQQTATTITLRPDEKEVITMALHHRFKEDERTNWEDSDIESVFSQNNDRWTKYMEQYQSLPHQKRMLASKCIQTLINNWRQPAGELAYEGLFPSYDYEWFHGFWSWDSWKQAVATVNFEPELAKNQIRTMYHFQDEFGMIADVVYRDTLIEKHNWRDTKPPLSAWSIRKVFEKTKDTLFLKELMPKLLKYHHWWYQNRDNNANGLCEFGSTDGTLVAAGWESGMDNAVRFDDSKMIKIDEHAWSLDQESVDLNAYLYNEKLHIASLLSALGQNDSSEIFNKEANLLKEEIQNAFYDPESRYFYDRSTTSSEKIAAIGPEAWTALWVEVATKEQAQGVVERLLDKQHFNTFLPFTTLSSSHPKFNPEKGYWRGPVWIDQAFFALEGMRNYGYEQEYREMREKLYQNAEGLLMKGTPIRENYDPRNGKGLNAKHFSWSAGHILMLLNSEVESGN